jgi:hypothetical protein
MVGPKKTITAVNGAALKRGLSAASRTAGASAIASATNTAS